MKLFKKNPKGFTLVEMILYVSICSILLLSLSSLLTFLLSSRIKNQSISEVNQQGAQIMELITQTIRNARSIDTPSVGATSSSLSITVQDPLLSPTLYYLNNGIIRIKEGGGVEVLLTNSHVTASSLLFSNISSTSSSDRIVQVSFMINYNNPNGRNEYSFSKVFSGSATMRQ